MPHRTAKQIHDAILKANHIVLVPHQNPDGDTLGCVASTMQYLRSIGKSHRAFCATDISPKLAYLPHIEYIDSDESVWDDDIDLVMVFDSGDLGYAGIKHHVENHKSSPVIVNIDHHATNQHFGHHNLVIDTASSTTEILYRFFSYTGINIDAAMATCLLTGLVTDTDHFTNAATSNRSFHIASELIRLGGNLQLIKGAVLKDKTVPALRLWGAVLNRLASHTEHEIVYTYVTQQDLSDHEVEDSEIEGIANFLNSIGEGRAGLLLKETKEGTVKGSFRTTKQDVDVSAYAVALGGGGHKKAAGFTVAGPIETALETVFTTIASVDAK